VAVKIYVDRDGIAWARISRAEKRNAWNSEVSRGLIDAASRASGDPGVVGLVITGEGDYFSAGVDLREVLEEGERGAVDEVFTLARRAFEAIALLEKPVVAAVNGPAYGISVELLHIVDYAIASRGASFAITGARLGLVPPLTPLTGWRNLGIRRAAYLAMSGRSLGAEDALRIGLVDEVVDREKLEERSREVVLEVSASDPEAVAAIKRAIAGERLKHIEEGFKLISGSAVRDSARRRIREFLSRR